MMIRKTMKLGAALLGAAVLFAPALLAQTVDESLPPIDAGTHALFYRLGGGPAVPAPGSNYVSQRVTARFKGGFGYSCGEFNFQENLSQMVNQLETQVREIPMQLQNAFWQFQSLFLVAILLPKN